MQKEELGMQNEELVLTKFAAEASLEKYTELYNFAPVGYFTLTNKGEVVEANLCGANMLGKERSLLKNSMFGFFVTNDTKPIFNLFIERVFNSGVNETCEVVLLAEGNPPKNVQLSGISSKNGDHCLLSTVDITDLKHTEQALFKSNITKEAIIKAIPDLLFVFNQNGDYLEGYAEDESKLLLPTEELKSKNIRDLFPQDIASKAIAAIKQTLLSKELVQFFYSININNKTEFYEARIVAASEDKVLAFVRNITERKQAELIIEQQNKELSKLNTDKDRFITILAHDLKNPFNVLLGLSEILANNIRIYNNDKVEFCANAINLTAKNTFSLLEDLLIWTRAQSGKLEYMPQDLNFTNICFEVIETLKPNANQKNITIKQFSAGEISLFVDMNILKSVLRNLISNAIKFTNTGGKITVFAEQNQTHVTITVSDNGIGIAPETISQLFDFSQLYTTQGTAKEKGSGLGLPLCKEFVEKLGGKIWVESEEGVGSTFYFTIPYNAEKEETSLKKDLIFDKKDIHIAKIKILVAEDDEMSEILISIYVNELSKEIIKARSGIEAVEACRNNPDIDLVLMDVQMPEMSGYEATRQIRQFNKEVVIIAQTAFGLSDDREKAITAGCNDYITKPIKKEELLAQIQKYFNK